MLFSLQSQSVTLVTADATPTTMVPTETLPQRASVHPHTGSISPPGTKIGPRRAAAMRAAERRHASTVVCSPGGPEPTMNPLTKFAMPM